MSLSSLADLDSRILAPNETVYAVKSLGAPVAGRTTSLFQASPFPGVTPTTAAVPVRDIVGAVGQRNGVTSALRALGVQLRLQLGQSGTFVLCDRLSHQGGLDGTVTGAQTTNLPTAALTRYTSGVGVWCALEIYGVVGTSTTVVEVDYTNQSGTPGQLSPGVLIGASSFRELTRLIMIPTAVGDTGFQSVESIELGVTTGTAGNFGVTLFKPLLYVPVVVGEEVQLDPIRGMMGGGFPEILDDACLYWIYVPGIASAPSFGIVIDFAED